MQLGRTTEHETHILALPSFEFFKTKLVLQEEHNELTQVRQLDISVQGKQVIIEINYNIEETNP